MTRRTTLLPVIDLSIDFDFWSYESPDWDWGHGEGGDTNTVFLVHIWPIRYAARDPEDLFEATALDRADFHPLDLFPELKRRNVRAVGRRGAFGAAESHKAALGFLLGDSPPDALLHIDAHHDCYPGRPPFKLPLPDCGNWLQHYMERHTTTDVTWLAPHWQGGSHMKPGPTVRPIAVSRWADWPGFTRPHQVRNVFLCRSGAWVPPHHDRDFGRLLTTLRRAAPRVENLSMIPDRTPIVPSRAWIKAQRAEMARLDRTVPV